MKILKNTEKFRKTVQISKNFEKIANILKNRKDYKKYLQIRKSFEKLRKVKKKSQKN